MKCVAVADAAEVAGDSDVAEAVIFAEAVAFVEAADDTNFAEAEAGADDGAPDL